LLRFARHDVGENYFPVFTFVHNRLMIRWVAASRAWIHEQLLLHRFVRIDIPVVQDFRVDQLLARQIAVGVGQKIRIFAAISGR